MPNSYIEVVLPKMMDDLLDIVVDPIYRPEIKPQSNKSFVHIQF